MVWQILEIVERRNKAEFIKLLEVELLKSSGSWVAELTGRWAAFGSHILVSLAPKSTTSAVGIKSGTDHP
jgi:hypothetical protein